MPAAPSVSLDKLAAIDAKIAAGLPRDRVLADAGVTAEAFDKAHDAWFARMASEAKSGKGRKLHKRYHELLRAGRKEAQREAAKPLKKIEGKAPKTPSARLSPLAAQYRPDAPQAIATPNPPAQLRLQSIETRSASAPPAAMQPMQPAAMAPPMQPMQPPAFVKTQPVPPEILEASDPLLRTVTVATSPLAKEAALPFKPSPMIGAVSQPPKARLETMAVKAFDVDEQTKLHSTPSKAALPFVQASQETNPLEQTQFAFRSVPRSDVPPARSGSSFDDLPTQVPVRTSPQKEALPFARTSTPASLEDAQTQIPMRAAPKEALPFVQPKVDNPLEQGTQAVRAGARKEALPFANSPSSPPPRPSEAPPNAGLPFQPTAAAAPQQAAAGLPFQRQSMPSVPPDKPAPAASIEQFDLTRYACLCAELAAFPQESERVFARYGLTEPRLRASVDATWRQRLGEDPKLYRTWQEYYQHYYAQWFSKGRRP